MTSEPRSRRGFFQVWRQVRWRTSAWALIAVVIAAGTACYPSVARRWAARRTAGRLAIIERTIERHAEDGFAVGAADEASLELSLRARRLEPLLSSWETIGGCGAGGSG